ncbi:MAG: OB-fold nucleic acid binding domain-containing protein, partial [Bradyrhizobium sp.]
ARRCALRLGFRQVTGLREADLKRMVDRRITPYRDPADLWRRGGLNKRQIMALARADAFSSMGLTRRDVLWAVRAFSEASLPLFEARPNVRDFEPPIRLPKLTLGEQVVDDYSTISMSLRAHPLQLLRPVLSERFMKHSKALQEARNGDRLSIAGIVLIRQRPGTASGVVFVTLEDEFGIANLVVWPSVFETYRKAVMGARMLAAKGRVQREGLVIHLVVEQLWDWSADLDSISALDGRFEPRSGRGDQARSSTPDPRDVPKHSPVQEKPAAAHSHDRDSVIVDRPVIRIASRDFH